MAAPSSGPPGQIFPDRFHSKALYLEYLRHLFAYKIAGDTVGDADLVVDLGCGDGYGTFYLASRIGRIIGFDLDEERVSLAKKRRGGGNCEFRVAHPPKLPFEDSSVDAVVSFQVIEHVEDDGGFVAEISRVLKEGGICLLTTPNKWNRLKEGQKPWNKEHLREYYPHELENVLRDKFSDVKVHGVRASEEIERIELDRIQPMKDQVRHPLSYFTWIIPFRIREDIRHGIRRHTFDAKSLDGYSIDDFFLSGEDMDSCLDILAICRR